jgi:anti-anti-sigma factor
LKKTPPLGFSFRSTSTHLECGFGAELRLITVCLNTFKDFASQGREIQGWQTAEVAIREILLNAMEHGSEWRAEAKIRFQATRLPSFRYQITIEDEGPGFNPPNLSAEFRNPLPEKRVGGLSLAFNYAEEITFGPQGKQICLLLKIPPRTDVSISVQGDKTVIRPAGSLMAEGASALREALREVWDADVQALDLDFSAVEFLDSASLSVLAVFGWRAYETRPHIPIRIRSASPAVLRVLHSTRLAEMFQLDERSHP